LHCGAPIRVPAIVGNVEAAFRGGAESSSGKSAVFNLRCPNCHKEKPYRTREIVNFDGPPDSMDPLTQPAPARFSQRSVMARTAKA